MPVRVTGWGGIGEIGGNKLLLEDGDWQVLLDFGKSFKAHGAYFEEFLTPRTAAGTFDYLRTGLLPPIEGLYRPDLESLPEVESFWANARGTAAYRSDVRPRALLLSHAHQDHHGHLGFLEPTIPVVSSAATALIVKGMQDSGQPSLENETVIVRPREADGAVLKSITKSGEQRSWFVTNGDAWTTDAASFWAQPLSNKNTADWTLAATSPFGGTIDGHQVLAHAVDHSIPGGCGFAVETSAGWVGYSGDIRLHGRAGKLTEQFAQALQSLELELLICEGTQAPNDPGAGEDDVRQDVHDAVADANSLVVGDFSARNFERLESFLSAARDSSRQLVVLEKDALLLHALHTADGAIPLPDAAQGLLIYRERRERGKAWSELVANAFGGAMIDADQIADAPHEFVLAMSFYDALRLLDVNADGGSWIYSTSEPYNEEQLLDMDRLRNWISLLGMDMLGGPDDDSGARLHASGHASGPDLLRFIEIARPRRLMPVHLEEGGLEFYRNHVPPLGIELVEPTWGQAIDVRA